MTHLPDYIYRSVRKYSHLYIKPCGWLIVHPTLLLKGARILGRSFKDRRYLSTLPRSGTVYITSLLTVACDIADGGTGEYYFADNEWIYNTRILWPSVLSNFVATLKNGQPIHENFIMIAHHPIQKTDMFRVKSMKVVFTVRNIADQLESWLLHTFDEVSAQDEFIKQGYVERTISYFNYWGDFISGPGKTPEKDYVCVKYEDMLSDPLTNLLRIVRFWDLEIGMSALQSAVDMCTREKMESKIPADLLVSNKRVSIRDNRGGVFSEENTAYINRAIRDNLRHDFGYKY